MNTPTNLIDLTHPIKENIPIWPGSLNFQVEVQQDFSPGKFRIYNYHLAAGTGTHFDAPFHCLRSGKTVAEFSLQELIAPGCIIDISSQVQQNCDYALTANDVTLWEKIHGNIPQKSIVLIYTGWSTHWADPKKYCNVDEQNVLHFPGFSSESAELLLKRNIYGVGIDTLSIDPGNSIDFPAHHLFLQQGLFQLENLANIDKLPPTGSTVFVLPMKIENAPEAPARVFAMIPAAG